MAERSVDSVAPWDTGPRRRFLCVTEQREKRNMRTVSFLAVSDSVVPYVRRVQCTCLVMILDHSFDRPCPSPQ